MMEFGPALQAMAIDHRFLVNRAVSPMGPVGGQSIASNNTGDAHESVSRVFFPHKVVVRDDSGLLDFSHSVAPVGDISLNQIAYGADVDVVIDDLQRSHFVLVIALTGMATVHFNQRAWALLGGDCVLMSPNVRYRFEMAADHTHLAIGIPSERLLGCGRPFEAVHSVMTMAHDNPRGGASQLMGFIEYLCGELHRASPLFDLPAVVSANGESLLAMVRAALFDKEAPNPKPSVLPGFIWRADSFISHHLKDNIELDDIVAAAGVPARTLYHGFHRFLGQSPMQTLKLRRLESARADLIASKGEMSVIALANQYWVGHSGRFARMYRDVFGESPSETIRQARDSAQGLAPDH